MPIRKGTYHDAPFIKLLMQALGYKTSNSLLVTQLRDLFSGNDHEVLVCEDNSEVTGFAVIHVLPQLAFDGSLLFISYLSVDERTGDQSTAKALEVYVTELARARKCERIQVHCGEWHPRGQAFYKQQGYQEYSQYFTKRLMYGE